MAELGACLALVSPSGMPDANRAEWLKVAHMTLADVPADLLTRGCNEARKRCRFPSEIVPTIIQTIERQWNWRLADDREARMKVLPQPEPEYVSAEEIRKLIKSIGSGA